MRRAFPIALALASLAPISSSATGTQRLYLLASSDDPTTWYSTDANDPELQGDWSCTTGPLKNGEAGCRGGLPTGGTQHAYPTAFYPRALAGGQITWNATRPLRFHVALSADTPTDIEVHFTVQHPGGYVVSPPAAEVSPGVYEGAITASSAFSPTWIVLLGVEVDSLAPANRIVIGTGGASWVDVETDVPIRSVPELIAADTYAPYPTTLTTGERAFEFNDDDFTHTTFSGVLVPSQAHTITIDREAKILVAWLEGFDEPIVARAATGGEVDPRVLVQFPDLRLKRGSETVAVNERSVATLHLAPGPVTFDVFADSLRSTTRDLFNGLPYTLHVLQIHGSRTLAAMRWTLPPARWNSFNTPVAASCPYPNEPIPQAPDATTFLVTLSSDAVTPGQKWTLTYDLPGIGAFPCGEAQTEDALRITLAGQRIWYMGPTPHRHTWFHSAQDVTFEMSATYTYSAP